MNRSYASGANSSRMGGSGGGRGVQCFNCDEYGHYSDQCPFPKRARKGKGGEPSIRMETVRLGGSGRTVTKVIEFESAEQEARCMEAWKGVVADMEVDKQMPVLRAFGKAIGVPCDREVEKEVRRWFSGRDITPVKGRSGHHSSERVSPLLDLVLGDQ